MYPCCPFLRKPVELAEVLIEFTFNGVFDNEVDLFLVMEVAVEAEDVWVPGECAYIVRVLINGVN